MNLQPLQRRPGYPEVVISGLRATALGSIAIATGIKNYSPADAAWVARMNRAAQVLVRLHNTHENIQVPSEYRWVHKIYMEHLRLVASSLCDLFDEVNQATSLSEHAAALNRYKEAQTRAWRCWRIVSRRLGVAGQQIINQQPEIDLSKAEIVA